VDMTWVDVLASPLLNANAHSLVASVAALRGLSGGLVILRVATDSPIRSLESEASPRSGQTGAASA
jgi:hypothetical protein